MRKYPIGIQSFREIIEGGYLYVDKTQLIHRLIESGKYYFFSRPRRFGKSLLLSTIKEIFSGSKELFKGLWIENNWNWEKKHPVIHLRFSKMSYQQLGLEEAIRKELDNLAMELNIKLSGNDIKTKFWELIKTAAQKEKVVILIDEYDKPIIDYLDDIEKVEENRAIFKSFYSVLKDADDYIRLLLITGVSRFTRVSIFSDLNNLNDITLHPKYTTLIGITQHELETNFTEEIQELEKKQPDILQAIREWYNGYSWDGHNKLYNPFSLLSYIEAGGHFDNFWIKTGTPSFLIKKVRERPDRFLFGEDDIIIGSEGLSDLYVENIHPITLMFQTGYLTIKNYHPEDRDYTLGYPNREVKESVLTHLMAAFAFEESASIKPHVTGLKAAFVRNDVDKVIKIIDTLFVTIPNTLWRGHQESFYHGLLHNTFQLLGLTLQSEVSISDGRMDTVVFTPTHIYVLEFKRDGSAEDALKQIVDKDYFRAYQMDHLKKIAVGINFSSEKKLIEDYQVREV